MDHRIWSAAALAVAGALAAPAHAAGASTPQAAASTDAADTRLAQSFKGWMDKVFAVPDTPDIDPPLREAVAALAKEHLARLGTLLPAWIAEERAQAGPAATDVDIGRAIHNRLVNEIALWRLESPGPGYDAILMHAILRPGLCDLPERDSYLGVLVSWFQAVPPADRPALLAGERTLLAHWGTPRAGLAPAPAKSLLEDEAETIARLRSGAAAPDAPMPPVLADTLFKDEAGEPWNGLSCARHQWGLAHALRRGEPAPLALAAWRYAMIRTSSDWAPPPPAGAKARAPTDFPRVAQHDGVSGSVAVRVTVDAQGRFGSAAIADRRLVVPGVRDNPPVAFARVFDAASLAMAPGRFKAVPPHADGSPLAPVMMRIEWKLE